MPLKATVRYPRPNVRRTTDKIHREMSQFILDVAKSWVIDVTNHVPVWSGASRASFLKLAHRVGVSISIAPVVKSRIPLGVETSIGILIQDRRTYGFIWESNLSYIQIVDRYNGFLNVGDDTIRRLTAPTLPQPVIEREGNDG